MTNGQGFIAVALVYFGSWTPVGVLGGALLFSEDQVEQLSAKSAKPVDRLFAVAQRLNGMRDEDVEELAGN